MPKCIWAALTCSHSLEPAVCRRGSLECPQLSKCFKIQRHFDSLQRFHSERAKITVTGDEYDADNRMLLDVCLFVSASCMTTWAYSMTY